MENAQKSDGSLFLCQERFALGIDEIVLTRKDDTLAEITTEERRRMRQTLGPCGLESHAECAMVTGTGFPSFKGLLNLEECVCFSCEQTGSFTKKIF